MRMACVKDRRCSMVAFARRQAVLNELAGMSQSHHSAMMQEYLRYTLLDSTD
jgi:hypothetical protein